MNNSPSSGTDTLIANGSFAPTAVFASSANAAMRSLERVLLEIAPTNIPVFITGESGTGKGALSVLVHSLSERRNEEFVRIHCSSASAATVAQWRTNGNSFLGLRENQNRGTVLLDEVLEMPLALQLHLIEWLSDDSGELSNGPAAKKPSRQAKARIIAASSHEAEEAIHSGRFREILYYRLKGVLLRIPPLRARKEDIPLLVDFFLHKHAAGFHRSVPAIERRTMEFFLRYPWPGNIRELENVVKTILVLGDQKVVLESLRSEAASVAEQQKVLEPVRISLKQASKTASRKVEKDLMAEVLHRNGWNRKRAAEELQISYKALLYKLKQVGLTNQPNEE